MRQWLVLALLLCAPGCGMLTGTPITLPPITIPPISIPPITIPLTSSPAPAVAMCAQPAAMQGAPSPVPVQVGSTVTPLQELHTRLKLSWLEIPLPYLDIGQVVETSVVTQQVVTPQYVATPQYQYVATPQYVPGVQYVAPPQLAAPLVCMPQQAVQQTAPPPLVPQVAQPTNAELCNRLLIAEDALNKLKQAAGCAPK